MYKKKNKLKSLHVFLLSTLTPSLFFLNACQQKKNDGDIDGIDSEKIKNKIDKLMKELNVNTLEELHDKLTKLKTQDIKISKSLLEYLDAKNLDEVIEKVKILIKKQDNSEKAHALACFMLGTKGIIPYDELKKKFESIEWKNAYRNEIEKLCNALRIRVDLLDSTLVIDDDVIKLAEKYANEMLPSFQKELQIEKDMFIKTFMNGRGMESEQITFLFNYLI